MEYTKDLDLSSRKKGRACPRIVTKVIHASSSNLDTVELEERREDERLNLGGATGWLK